jgi:hypothetical protein
LVKFKQFLAALMIFSATSAIAGEGMWMPQQIPQLAAELRELGIEIDPNRLADLTGDPMGAIVSLGGCTASFVSPQGLVVTNHHCATGTIQFNSTPERNLIENGFLAHAIAEELPGAPGTRVWVTNQIEDVTARVTAKIPARATDEQRFALIERRRKELIDECERAEGVRCSVPSFFEGSQYLRIRQMEIRDVRLVYAPARGIGEFGGEIDNWMWPRHTGDFTFLRAYVAPDGRPADFSAENVPYQPQHFLKVSTSGVNEGDLILVAGYPGRTQRYRTAEEIVHQQDFFVPTTLRYARELNQILEAESQRSKEVEIANAARIRSNANLLKNFEGQMEVFATGSVLRHRQQREADLARFFAENPDAARQYGSALQEIARVNEQARARRDRDLLISWIYRSSPMLSQASTLYRLSLERGRKDLDRESGYRERDWPQIQQSIARTQRSIDPGSDRAGLRHFLLQAAALPAGQRIAAIDQALAATGASGVEAQVDAFLDQLYAGTTIADQAVREEMFTQTPAQLRGRNDAMLNFAIAMTPLLQERELEGRRIEGAMMRVRPLYLNALRLLSGGMLYPDANSTLRVTYGTVQGYRPRDAVYYAPQTTLTGLLRKETGEEPFDNPPALLAAARTPHEAYVDRKLGDVPVNFLSTVDSTGGNSGSPSLNARGELNGLLFDGNYEAMGSDYLVDPELTRSIHVDAVFMLWVMDAVDRAHNLLREMGLPVHHP